jgi:hypothetical protein
MCMTKEVYLHALGISMLMNIAPRIAFYKAAAEPSMLFDQAKVDTNGSCAPVDYSFDCVLLGELCHCVLEHLKENLFASHKMRHPT